MKNQKKILLLIDNGDYDRPAVNYCGEVHDGSGHEEDGAVG
jgi:hypothetical protein